MEIALEFRSFDGTSLGGYLHQWHRSKQRYRYPHTRHYVIKR